MQKCPVPIKLTRIKTDYTHTGYLDVDAIVSIQDYLSYKYDSFVTSSRRKGIDVNYLPDKSNFLKPEIPLFTTRENVPVSINWVSRAVPRLATKSGIQKIIKGNRKQKRTEKNGHELRDLLKSTLITCGTADYVCELAIGHKVGDSYSKQDLLYPEKSRSEYAKASSKINIFSKVSNLLDNDGDSEQYKMMYEELKADVSNTVRKELQIHGKQIQDDYDLRQKNMDKVKEDSDKEFEEMILKAKNSKIDVDTLKQVIELLQKKKS